MQANFVAGSAAPIYPSTFVQFDSANSKAVNPATSTNQFLVGISQEFCAQAPIPGQTLTAAAATGDPIMVYQLGDTCLLFSTTAGWSNGAYLTSSAAGYGVTATSSQLFGAKAITAAATQGLYQVTIVQGTTP